MSEPAEEAYIWTAGPFLGALAIIAGQRDSAAKRGERYVDGATRVVIDGDRATADVTYHFDKEPRGQGVRRDRLRAPGRGVVGLFDRPQFAVGHSRP